MSGASKFLAMYLDPMYSGPTIVLRTILPCKKSVSKKSASPLGVFPLVACKMSAAAIKISSTPGALVKKPLDT